MINKENSAFIGIDLGTSNSVIALQPSASRELAIIPVPQPISPGVLESQGSLPSALYLPPESESSPSSSAASVTGHWIPGVYARERASEMPERVITSAKSWLCHETADRRADILPWDSNLQIKLSPVAASTLLLKQLRSAVDEQLLADGVDSSFVTITVPASFDEVARQLTHEAALAAGFKEVTLLEEPIAALYCWLNQNEAQLSAHLKPGETILICDVGGGTTDFSLVQMITRAGKIEFERLSVGDHILLGGDNMDHALAHTVSTRLSDNGTELDRWQFISLIHQARKAKEILLSDNAPESVNISVLKRGSRLFAQTISESISKAEAAQIVLDGFTPICDDTARATHQRATALRETGLAYAIDPAITRHLASFLAKSLDILRARPEEREAQFRTSRSGTLFVPDFVLFNGGVFGASALRDRILEQLAHWGADYQVSELRGTNFDQAVALGAVHFTRAKTTGEGLRIRAGSARSLYVGVESAALAVPGVRPTLKGVCIVPQGLEEGSEVSLKDMEFSLTTGHTVKFRVFCSSERPEDSIGSVVPNAERALQELPALELTVPTEANSQSAIVTLSAVLNDVGVVEVWLNSINGEKRWKLEFDLRGLS